jgi:ribosomal protein S18 acetylase RimI-like enzyme
VPYPLATSSRWLNGSTPLNIQIIELDGPAIEGRLDALSQILTDSVAEGAAISFMAPLSYDDAARFWSRDVQPEVTSGRRVLFGAAGDDNLLGTVQLITAMPPNQPHRCEIAKMIVHPRARRLGIGRSLMNHALHRARELGKTLVTLDTRTGDVGESLYTSIGFEVAGVIPDFAWNPDGKARHATTYMFRQI